MAQKPQKKGLHTSRKACRVEDCNKCLQNIQTCKERNINLRQRQRISEKLVAEEVQTVSFAIGNRPQEMSFESEHLALPQATSSGSTLVYLSSNDVINFKQIFLDVRTEIGLFNERLTRSKLSSESPVRCSSNFVPFLTRGLGQTLFLNQLYGHRCKIAFNVLTSRVLQTEIKKPLELEPVLSRHAYNGDLKVSV